MHQQLMEMAKNQLATEKDEYLEKIANGWLPNYVGLEESEVKA